MATSSTEGEKKEDEVRGEVTAITSLEGESEVQENKCVCPKDLEEVRGFLTNLIS